MENSSSMEPECTEGVFLPFIQSTGWNTPTRATLYFIELLYLFLGAAVVTEYVMASSSIITSTKKKIYLSKPESQPDKGGKELDVIEVRVWHETMWNIAFSAFNTSATEILLCALEIISNNFDHGELGPGTIVGAGAFNMLVVTSICMVSIPGSETRKIERLLVYFVSLIFSLAGYIWILVILRYISPGVITLWESVVTILMFPVYILLVWLSHHDWWGLFMAKVFHGKPDVHQKSVDEISELDENLLKDGKLDRENLARLVHKLKRHSGLTDHDAATLAAFKLLQNQPHSTIWYRIGGIRTLTGGHRDMNGLEARLRRAYRSFDRSVTFEPMSMRSTIGSTNRSMTRSAGATTTTSTLYSSSACVVEFHSAIVAVNRAVGYNEVTISRHGNFDIPAKVRLTTIDGTAKKNRDYVPIDQIVVFEPGVSEISIPVLIMNPSGWEDEAEFFLRLSLIHNDHENVALGRMYMMAVTIIDGNKQSIITFEKRGQMVKESAEMVTVLVSRHDGAQGTVSVKWRTQDKSAIAGKDYVAGTGELVFKTGEMSLYVEITIINHMTEHKDVYFEIELFAPSGGAKLGRINRCTVTITNDDDLQSLIGTMASITTLNLEAIRVKKSSWARQIRDALLVDGGDVENATKWDYLAHFLAFLWKVAFSIIPPPTMLGGWPCLMVSLTTLGVLTLLIDDVATAFGCLINMDETITAISIVALGTSMPEVLCARKETVMERTADVAMVGTAARMAANMMLGLGMPWLVAVVYHEIQGTAFEITDPEITLNVAVFISTAAVAQILLTVRRLTPCLGKAEIGGPPTWKWTTFAVLILLWIAYLTLAHYFMHGHISPIESDPQS